MKLKTLGLLGALVFAVPVAAVAAPAGGLTAQGANAATTAPLIESNADVDSSAPAAQVQKVWWRGGWGGRRGFGWRGGWGGWRGYGWRGYGWRGGWRGYGWRGYGWRGGWGWRRRWW